MPFFSPEFLASLRATNQASLDSRATIARSARSASPGGGANTGTLSWATIDDGTDVPCRLGPMGAAAVVVQAGQVTTPERVLVVFDLGGPVIADGDRLTITGTTIAGDDWERTVRVLSALTPATSSAMRQFVCEQFGPGAD